MPGLPKIGWRKSGVAFAAAIAAIGPASAFNIVYPPWSDVQITDQDLGGGLHMLHGYGGNISVLVTPDGLVMVDSEFPQLWDKIRARVNALSSKRVVYFIGTHFHFDHIGNMNNLAVAGATTIASEETARFIAEEQKSTSKVAWTYPNDQRLLPEITLSGSMTIHIAGEKIDVLHIGPAHTAGDLIVRFRNADVIQTGDAFFNGFYPSLDVEHGGTIDGAIAFCDQLYALSGPHTRIIPGHGEIADRAYILRYRTMLQTVRYRVARAIGQGRSLQQIIDAKPLADLDEAWGGDLIKAPDLIEMTYDSLQPKLQH